ncbi:uncharacterized protein LOC130265559 isoform X1 [Oenanthe melanoleuca]|uniref:uncharacterized protein LOC130265559 isoform X1 n=1 Tax=Oenanthe melanoleuca TaxID=2939378 RepID=UPI0024C10013|nr:uncharacterized protein LOC130265559 isoform X1 [Oenanthe melanoleuca]
MIEELVAAVCTLYGIGYSGYYLTNLACHLRRVFRDAARESTEPTADSPLVPTAPGEEAKDEAKEEHKPPAVVTAQPEYSELALLERDHKQIALAEVLCQTQGELRQQVEEQQENGQNIKGEPQAELPKVQIGIMTVKRRKKEDVRIIQYHRSLHRQRGDQENQVKNFNEKLPAELQEAEAQLKAREKCLEEEMKIVKKKIHPLLRKQEALEKRVKELTSHPPACEDFQEMTGNKETRGQREAGELSQSDMPQVWNVLKMLQEKRTQ